MFYYLKAVYIYRILIIIVYNTIISTKSNLLVFLDYWNQTIKYISLIIFDIHIFSSNKSAINYIYLLPNARNWQ